MSNVLVLGHNGMLGRAVVKYLKEKTKHKVETTQARWGQVDFVEAIKKSDVDFIVNCIGKIPQKNPSENEYESLNVDLPCFLEATGKLIIHPSTDCEFNGDLPPGKSYTKESIRDAKDAYGQSKAKISKMIEDDFTHTKIIRTSIIGHENGTQFSLLDWFLSQTDEVNGFTNHYWNGITTVQWAEICEKLIEDWSNFPTLNQFGTNTQYSKFEVLTCIKKVYEKDTSIRPFATEYTINKCLKSDVLIPELEDQLMVLKKFFADN
ncbi:sugar nucleotide-binding protein [Candidatus Nomurabacteria bacterium]|nr:sugar nucleotide-binding protein [Candidatus Nomurabacteria bacterium]